MNETHLHSFNVDLSSINARQSGNDGDKTFFLNHGVDVPANMHMTVSLTNFVMPLSFYDIRSTNNTFDFELNFSDVLYSVSITIPEGNYTASQMKTQLNILFANEILNLNNTSVVVSIDNTKAKFLFTLSQEPTSCTISNCLPYRQLGFNTTDNVFNGLFFYSPNIFDFAGSPVLYLRLVNKGLKNINSYNNFGGILAMIPVKAYPYELIFYHESQPQHFKVSNDISEMNLIILDENFENIPDLQGVNWRCTLTFNYHYNKDIIQPSEGTDTTNFIQEEQGEPQQQQEEKPKRGRPKKKKDKKNNK